MGLLMVESGKRVWQKVRGVGTLRCLIKGKMVSLGVGMAKGELKLIGRLGERAGDCEPQ